MNVVVACRHDRHVNLATLQASRQARAAVLDQMHLDAGMPSLVLRQEIDKQALDRLRRGADPEHSCLPGLERARPLAEQLDFGQQAPAAPKQVFALRRELNAATDPIEQRHSQLGFQRVDLPRERRLTQVQAGGRTRKAAGVGDGGEGAQMPEVHAAMITILHQ